MTRVTVLTTGGTVSQRTSEGVSTPGFDPRELLVRAAIPGVATDVVDVMSRGSKDVGPRDWMTLARALENVLRTQPTGVVILHGTDTMHYTAAALSFMIRGPGLPIVLTGSMRPGGDVDSDAVENLRDALRVAAFADLGEVCIALSGDDPRSHAVVLRGNCARKVHSTSLAAFDSPNIRPLATVTGEVVSLLPRARRRARGPIPQILTRLADDVVLVKLTPGLTRDRLEQMLHQTSAAVLEGTGVGHMAENLHPAIRNYGKPVVMATQVWRGGEHLGLYASDAMTLALPNLIPAGPLSSETALVKLMWALAATEDVREAMRTDVAGETEFDRR